MRVSRIGAAVLLGTLFLAAGCPPNRKVEPPAPAPVVASPRINVAQLAKGLNLKVAQQTPQQVTLNGGADCVTIFADPDGAVYVNGHRLKAEGPFLADDATITVPGSLAGLIKPLLHARPDVRVSQRPVKPPVQPPVRPPQPPRGKVAVVVLDAGHGGRDSGTIGVNGLLEKDVVLRVARMIGQRLAERSVKVVMTRDSDEFLELEDRPAVANRLSADLFLAVHADSAPNREACGHTVYVARSPSAPSVTAANCLVRHMDASDSRGLRQADYRVLVRATVPAVLVEIGYLSNRAEAAMLATDRYCATVADDIVTGILDFLPK